MTHFPLTESLGIKIRKPTIGNIVAESFDYVLVRDLEAVLEKAQRVTREKGGLWYPNCNDPMHDEQALLINIQPIQRKVEFETRVFNKMALGSGQMIETASHIEKSELDPFVGKKVRVTIEEVP